MGAMNYEHTTETLIGVLRLEMLLNQAVGGTRFTTMR